MLQLLDFLCEAVLLHLLIRYDCDGNFDGLLAVGLCFIRGVSFGLGFRRGGVCWGFVFILGVGGGFGKIAFR